MSPPGPPRDDKAGGRGPSLDDAEKGMVDHSAGLPIIMPGRLSRKGSSSSDEKSLRVETTSLTPLSVPAEIGRAHV